MEKMKREEWQVPAEAAKADESSVVAELRKGFRSGKTRSLKWRKEQLRSLHRMVVEKEEEMMEVLRKDLGKPRVEAFRDEIGAVKKSIELCVNSLKKWMAGKRVRIPLLAFPTTGHLLPEPLGVVLVFSSWNFPIVLSLDPLVGALAAGNSVVIKPSELSPASSAFLARTVPQYLDEDAVRIVQGGEAVATRLLECKWDHIFFTGSPRVGRVIMSAAAKHLTPVTLELGGKCPAILDTYTWNRDAEVAMNRLANGKWGVAGGQACIGVDYLLVEEKHAQSVIESLKRRITKFYGDDPKAALSGGRMTRIVNRHHFQRLLGLINDPDVAASIVHGGQHDEEKLCVEPTILLNPPLSSHIMTEEIFGPLLPIITVKKIEDSIDIINSLPKPLAIYGFTRSESLKKRILAETSSGSVTFNDAVVQFLVDTLPFGGVGQSGFGRYHGKFSFDTFSHQKAVLSRNLLLEFSFGYPPWNDTKLKTLRSAFRYNYPKLVMLLLGLKK